MASVHFLNNAVCRPCDMRGGLFWIAAFQYPGLFPGGRQYIDRRGGELEVGGFEPPSPGDHCGFTGFVPYTPVRSHFVIFTCVLGCLPLPATHRLPIRLSTCHRYTYGTRERTHAGQRRYTTGGYIVGLTLVA